MYIPYPSIISKCVNLPINSNINIGIITCNIFLNSLKLCLINYFLTLPINNIDFHWVFVIVTLSNNIEEIWVYQRAFIVLKTRKLAADQSVTISLLTELGY